MRKFTQLALMLAALLLAMPPAGASPDVFTDADFTNPEIQLDGIEVVAGGVQLLIMPERWTKTTKADFGQWLVSENVIAVEPGHVKLEVATGDNWTWARDTITGTWGQAVVGTGENVYIARGTGFYRYRPADGSWTRLTDPPRPDGAAFKTGTALSWDNGNFIYALFGAAQGDVRRWFYRYSISGDSWEALESTPADQGEGNAIAWVGLDNHLYATIGGEERWTYFVRFNPSENTWDDAAVVDPPAGMGDGAALTWAGDNHLFALRGEYHGETPLHTFWRYDLTTDIWRRMEDIPASPHGERDGVRGVGGVGDGGSLLHLGLWCSDQADFIYALSGEQTHPKSIPDNRFYRYTISTDTWERLADLPFGVGHFVGSRLGYAGGHIYAWQGAPSTWVPGRGNDLARYEFALHHENGYFTSSVFDAGETATWQRISWRASEPEDRVRKEKLVCAEPENLIDNENRLHSTTVRVWTRASSDNSTWSRWVERDNGDDLPYENRYLQYKVELSTDDRGATPMLHELVTDYVPSTKVSTGTFTSQPLELGHVEDWGTLSWDAALLENTSISFATRSSPNGSNWSEWDELGSSVIQSLTYGRPYLQVRATLQGVGLTSPTLRSYSVIYTPDRAPPSVTITTPSEGFSTMEASIVVSGTLSDSNPATLEVNGRTIAWVPGSFSTRVSLAPGLNEIHLVAEDAAGNRRELKLKGTHMGSPLPAQPVGCGAREQAALVVAAGAAIAALVVVRVFKPKIAPMRRVKGRKSLAVLAVGPVLSIVRVASSCAARSGSGRRWSRVVSSVILIAVLSESLCPMLTWTGFAAGWVRSTAPMVSPPSSSIEYAPILLGGSAASPHNLLFATPSVGFLSTTPRWHASPARRGWASPWAPTM